MQIARVRLTKYSFALLAIVLIGLFLRVYQLGTQSLEVDEAFSVWISKMSVAQIVPAETAIPGYSVFPPFYYFLLHYWMIIFGTSESAVRLLSALFGVLAILMIYMVGRQLFDEKVALVGALILALSSCNIWYSQEARMYSLMVLLALFSMYFFLRFLQRSTLASSAAYVLSTTLLLYTHYYGVFVVLAQNIYLVTLLLSKKRTFKLRQWVALQAIVLTLFIPWIVMAINQTSPLGAELVRQTPVTLTSIGNVFLFYSGGEVLLAFFLGLSVLSLFAYQKKHGAVDWKAPLEALKSYSREVHLQDPTPVYFLVVWLVVISLIPFLVSLIPLVTSRSSAIFYLNRYTLAASIALFLLAAKGIWNINHRWAKLAVIGIIAVLSIANLQGYYSSRTDQAREATSFIDAHAKSGDVVLACPGPDQLTFEYYNNRTDVAVKFIHFWRALSDKNPKADTDELQSYVNGHERIWLFDGAYTPTTKNFILNFLNQSYAKSYVKKYVGYDVYLYETRA